MSLSKEDKINVLRYIRGTYALSRLETYESRENAPNENPRAEYLYISDVLGFDFEAFYDQPMERFQATKEEVEKMFPEGFWFIGDKISGVLHKHLSSEYGIMVDEDLINKIDSEIREKWNGFVMLENASKPENKKKYPDIIYIPTGIVYNGEELYRRVEE